MLHVGMLLMHALGDVASRCNFTAFLLRTLPVRDFDTFILAPRLHFNTFHHNYTRLLHFFILTHPVRP